MRKTIVLAIMFVIFSFNFCNAAQGDNRFEQIGSNNKITFAFDTKTIKYDRNFDGTINTSTIDFWLKTTYTREGVNDLIETRTKADLKTEGFYNIDYSILHYKLDLIKNKLQVLSLVHYNKDGAVLENYMFSNSEWTDIIPNSNGEVLSETISEYTSQYSNLLKLRR